VSQQARGMSHTEWITELPIMRPYKQPGAHAMGRLGRLTDPRASKEVATYG